MRRALLLLAAALAGCQSFGDDMRELRAEIVRLEREMPPESPLWISEGPNAFEQYLRDYTEDIPDFIFNHLARKLSQIPYEETAAESQGLFPVETAFKDPASVRGRFWKIRGTITNLEPSDADREAGVEQTYTGILFMDHLPVLFHVVDKPEFVVLGQDVVESNAVFLKIIRYTTRSGRRVDAAFLMGRRLGKYF